MKKFILSLFLLLLTFAGIYQWSDHCRQDWLLSDEIAERIEKQDMFWRILMYQGKGYNDLTFEQRREYEAILDSILEVAPDNMFIYQEKIRLFLAESRFTEARALLAPYSHNIGQKLQLCLLDEYKGRITAEEASSCYREVTAMMREKGADIYLRAGKKGDIDSHTYIGMLCLSGEMTPEELDVIFPKMHESHGICLPPQAMKEIYTKGWGIWPSPVTHTKE